MYFETHPFIYLLKQDKEKFLERQISVNGSFSRPYNLLVDGNEALSYLCEDASFNFAAGGDWAYGYRSLKKLIDCAENQCIKLVFVFKCAFENNLPLTKKIKVNNGKLALKSMELNKKGLLLRNNWVQPFSAEYFTSAMLLDLKTTVIWHDSSNIREVIKNYAIDGVVTNDVSIIFTALPSKNVILGSELTINPEGHLTIRRVDKERLEKHLGFDLVSDKFAIFGCLLENLYLTREDLFDFYVTLNVKSRTESNSIDAENNEIIDKILNLVRNLKNVDDVQAMTQELFSNLDDRRKVIISNKFVRCLRYYGNRKIDLLDKLECSIAREIHIFNQIMLLDDDVSRQALKITRGRFQLGIVHPWIFQLLTTHSIEIPETWNVYSGKTGADITEFLRPIRVAAYSILLQQPSSERYLDPHRVFVQELMIDEDKNTTSYTIEVTQKNINDYPLDRLWWGDDPEDEHLRAQAFEESMSIEGLDLLNSKVIPEEIVALCVALRFILKQSTPIFTEDEFIAILVTAIDPNIDKPRNSTFNDREISARTTYIGQLINLCIEHILFLNDVCAQPLKKTSCKPWKFLNGTILQHKLYLGREGYTMEETLENDTEKLPLAKVLKKKLCLGLPRRHIFLSNRDNRKGKLTLIQSMIDKARNAKVII